MNKRSKKGFGTILVSAIMLSSLSTMGVVVVGWSNNVVSAQENRIADVYVERSNAIQEVYIIEDVLFDGTSPKYVHVTVKNVGELPIVVTSITIKTDKWSPPTPYLINPDKSATFDITYDWTAGSLNDIVIQTERMNTINQSWMS